MHYQRDKSKRSRKSKSKSLRAGTHKAVRLRHGTFDENKPYATRDAMKAGRRTWGTGVSPDDGLD